MRPWVIVSLLILGASALGHAAEFRTISPIATPAALPEGARPVAVIQPVDGGAVEAAVRQFVESYNGTGMRDIIDDSFYDKSRLLDSMSSIEKMPPDARLRLLSTQGMQTLNQYTMPGAGGGSLVVSTVSATLRTQIEFNDPQLGFQRIEGTNQVLLQITLQAE